MSYPVVYIGLLLACALAALSGFQQVLSWFLKMANNMTYNGQYIHVDSLEESMRKLSTGSHPAVMDVDEAEDDLEYAMRNLNVSNVPCVIDKLAITPDLMLRARTCHIFEGYIVEFERRIKRGDHLSDAELAEITDTNLNQWISHYQRTRQRHQSIMKCWEAQIPSHLADLKFDLECDIMLETDRSEYGEEIIIEHTALKLYLEYFADLADLYLRVTIVFAERNRMHCNRSTSLSHDAAWVENAPKAIINHIVPSAFVSPGRKNEWRGTRGRAAFMPLMGNENYLVCHCVRQVFVSIKRVTVPRSVTLEAQQSTFFDPSFAQLSPPQKFTLPIDIGSRGKLLCLLKTLRQVLIRFVKMESNTYNNHYTAIDFLEECMSKLSTGSDPVEMDVEIDNVPNHDHAVGNLYSSNGPDLVAKDPTLVLNFAFRARIGQNYEDICVDLEQRIKKGIYLSDAELDRIPNANLGQWIGHFQYTMERLGYMMEHWEACIPYHLSDLKDDLALGILLEIDSSVSIEVNAIEDKSLRHYLQCYIEYHRN
ncbi:hypothetical protein FA15DRAFT_660898 [Coprinopsis marcescibilis]|uniref:Uncharacterized protein n=1 Tax=Coprinopsis marcescibilis TaxID=230819 RepID=A0A5C3KEM1_COPMA|nr:hypothetical protein FA15DRAFT_660898 [Coprinopsis marcescibilis]